MVLLSSQQVEKRIKDGFKDYLYHTKGKKGEKEERHCTQLSLSEVLQPRRRGKTFSKNDGTSSRNSKDQLRGISNGAVDHDETPADYSNCC